MAPLRASEVEPRPRASGTGVEDGDGAAVLDGVGRAATVAGDLAGSLLASTTAAIAGLDAQGVVRWANLAFDELFEGEGDQPWDLVAGGSAAVEASVGSAHRGRQTRIIVEVPRGHIRLSFAPTGDPATPVVVAADDITASVRTARQLAEAAARFRVAFDQAPAGMAIADATGTITQVNDSLCELSGRGVGDLRGRPLEDLVHAGDRHDLAALVCDELDGAATSGRRTVRIDRGSNEPRWAEVAVSLVHDAAGRPDHFVVQLVDVTLRQLAERARDREQAELTWWATHDVLTGLPNRRFFLDHLAMAINRTGRTGAGLAVLFCDLDRFKPVNDEFGHGAGDDVLRTIAVRIGDVCRDADLVARWGGDEFVVSCEGIGSRADAVVIANRISAAVTRPVPVEGRRVAVGVSIGIATWRPGESVEHLIGRADGASYDAKAAGGGFAIAAG